MSPVNHVFGLWNESPKGNPQRNKEKIQTPHRKDLNFLGIKPMIFLPYGDCEIFNIEPMPLCYKLARNTLNLRSCKLTYLILIDLYITWILQQILLDTSVLWIDSY